MPNEPFYLLIALFTCHWVADYTPLSTPVMLKAKATGRPYYPILLHGFTHGALMFLAVGIATLDLWLSLFTLAFQGATHFLIDILKGRMNVWFPSVKDTTKYFHWVIFGLDQLLHAIVILIIAKIVTNA